MGTKLPRPNVFETLLLPGKQILFPRPKNWGFCATVVVQKCWFVGQKCLDSCLYHLGTPVYKYDQNLPRTLERAVNHIDSKILVNTHTNNISNITPSCVTKIPPCTYYTLSSIRKQAN